MIALNGMILFLSALIDKHAPLKSRIIHIRPRVPWMNNDIMVAKRLKRKDERRAGGYPNLILTRRHTKTKRKSRPDIEGSSHKIHVKFGVRKCW